MAGPQTRQSLCYNPPTVSKDKLSESALGAATNGNGISAPNSIPAVSYSLIPAPAPALAPQRDTYTNVNLEKVTKLALKSFVQGQAHTQELAEPRKKPLKARFSYFYCGNFHQDCYHFC